MRWINLGMFVFRTYKNHRSEIASSYSPSLLQMLETEIEKKRKNETSEDFGGEETGCIDKRRGFVIIPEGATCAISEHGTCSTLSFERMNIGQRSSSNKQQVTRTP